MRPLPCDGMRQVRAGIRNPSQTQRSRDGIGMAGLSQHADSMLAAPVVGEAPIADLHSDGAWGNGNAATVFLEGRIAR